MANVKKHGFERRVRFAFWLVCIGICLAVSAHAEEPVSFSTSNNSPAAMAIKKALAENTSFEFIESPLSDVIQFFKSHHKIEIQIDTRALADANVTPDTQITRALKDISLRSALRLLLRDLELTYVVRDEVLLITSKTAADAILDTRVYPVGDLIYSEDNNPMAKPTANFESLIEVMTSNCNPTSWTEVGGQGSVKPFAKTESLVISQTGEVHELIEELLATLRRVREAKGGKAESPKVADQTLHVKVYALFVSPFLPGSGRGTSGGISASASITPDTGPSGNVLAQTLGGAVTSSVIASPSSQRLNESAGELAKLLPELIEPKTWHVHGGQGTINAIGSTLVVRQTIAVHQQVSRLVREFQQANP